jgi:TRAP-type C4-dicarboxylate transport system permease small subunit
VTTLLPPMSRRIALITTLLVLATASPAFAQGAFGPLPAASTPTPTAAATATPTDDNDTARNTLYIIGGALIVGFAVMGWFILRDARRKLPEEEVAQLNRSRDDGPHAHKLKSKERARDRGRRSRQARKRNQAIRKRK